MPWKINSRRRGPWDGEIVGRGGAEGIDLLCFWATGDKDLTLRSILDHRKAEDYDLCGLLAFFFLSRCGLLA